MVINHETWIPRGMWEMIWKNIHYIWVSHFTWKETHRCWKYSLSLYFNNTACQWGMCWPTDWQSKPSLKLEDRGRKIRNNVHIDTYYCRPEFISWRLVNIKMFNTNTPSPTDQKCADSSSITGHVVNFYILAKGMMPITRYVYIYTYIYLGITLSIIDIDFICVYIDGQHYIWTWMASNNINTQSHDDLRRTKYWPIFVVNEMRLESEIHVSTPR